MNTIWLKLAGAIVAIIIVLVVIGQFTGGKSPSTPAPQNKTFDDMVQRDKQFGKEPKPVEQEAASPQANAQQAVAGPNVAAAPAAQPAQTVPQPTRTSVLPKDITQKTTMYFKPLSEEDDLQAQQLLPWATTTRSIGRLPMMSPGPMVKTCRDILSRWPDSWYALRAKQMLADIYETRGAAFNITEQEMDISRFLKPRPGTQPREVEPIR